MKEVFTHSIRYVQHKDGWRYRIREVDDGCVEIQYEQETDATSSGWEAHGEPLLIHHEWWQHVADAAAKCVSEYLAAATAESAENSACKSGDSE